MITILEARYPSSVFQVRNLLPTLATAANTALPLLRDGWYCQGCAVRVEELWDLVDLGERRAHRPDPLSGGKQQRAAIVRALVPEPAIFMADEPSGNLDCRGGRGAESAAQQL
jgi:predicted ABC-type transport system involved in lysophospholipase L1 biosynthesis ATPase subunit